MKNNMEARTYAHTHIVLTRVHHVDERHSVTACSPGIGHPAARNSTCRAMWASQLPGYRRQGLACPRTHSARQWKGARTEVCSGRVARAGGGRRAGAGAPRARPRRVPCAALRSRPPRAGPRPPPPLPNPTSPPAPAHVPPRPQSPLPPRALPHPPSLRRPPSLYLPYLGTRARRQPRTGDRAAGT